MSRIRTLLAATSLIATAAGTFALAPANAAGQPIGRVTAHGGLVSRVAPTTHAARVGNTVYRQGARLVLDCKVVGTNVGGNRLWYTIASDGSGLVWVPARYVRNIGTPPPYCNPMHGTVGARTTTVLNKRQGPSVRDAWMGRFNRGAYFRVVCRAENGARNWLLTSDGRWVAAGYVHTARRVAICE